MRRRIRPWLMAGMAAIVAGCSSPPMPTSPPLAAPTPTEEAVRPLPAATPTLAPTVAPAPTPPPTPPPTAVPTAALTEVPTTAASPELAAAVEAALARGIERGDIPGGVVHVRHRGEVILHAAYGQTFSYHSADSRAPDPIPARPDSLYDLASLTKLFTATALMRLIEDGQLRLDDPVADHLPEFGANGKQAITIRQLLTHTGGLPARLNLWELESTPEAGLRGALAVEPIAPPGTVYRYSDMGPIILGHLVERAAGATLDRAVAELVTGPLGLEQTRYRPPAELRSRIAPTEDQSAIGRGLVWGEPHDENAWALGGVAGHAGLFGTAAELGVFGQMFLDGGTYGGVRLLQPETVADMTRSQIGGLAWRGLGWELNGRYFMGRLASPDTYGHTGFTGTSLVVDPQRQLVVVLLTNRVHPSRERPSPNPYRQAVADAARAAVDGP